MNDIDRNILKLRVISFQIMVENEIFGHNGRPAHRARDENKELSIRGHGSTTPVCPDSGICDDAR